jgi:hypothetical protein
MHCQGGANTGCETNVRTDVNHCGSCTNTCAGVQHATGVACSAGGCTYTSCQSFFDDLDGNKANGCESACGAEGQSCCSNNPRCMGNLICNGGGKCVVNDQ